MKTKHTSPARSIVLAALFLALAFVLPMVTGHVPQVGNMLCPMHFPILLCGFVLGGPWGLAVGFAAPLLRSVLFGMPPLYPIALSMAFELAAYGAVSSSSPHCRRQRSSTEPFPENETMAGAARLQPLCFAYYLRRKSGRGLPCLSH